MRLIRPVRASGLAVGLVVGLVCSLGVATTDAAPIPVRAPLPLPPADPADPITDPRLEANVAGAEQARTEGRAEPRVAVEVLTPVDDLIAQRIVELGGSVTGSVPGEVVQASMPAGQVEALALSPGVQAVQAPRRVNQRPSAPVPPPSVPQRAGAQPGDAFGGSSGQQVALTNATAWHAAGLTGGGTRVGIIDYFSMNLWNTAEQGDKPSVENGRMFCLDTSGVSPNLCRNGVINPSQGVEHGLAVTEIVKDMAPATEIYIATVGTVSDLRAAIDWFAASGVTIVSRSLGSAYDGPGDGTGPLDATVDYAATKGIVWFNSAGNDALDVYMKRTVPTNLGADDYVDFDRGPGIDTYLRIDGTFIWFDGIRWSTDWYTTAKTDYQVEFWQPTTASVPVLTPDHVNPTADQLEKLDIDPFTAGVQNVIDAPQRLGADPLEVADLRYGTSLPFTYVRIRRNPSTPVGPTPDIIEVALVDGLLESGYSDVPGSAAKPAVDSRNPALIAVGAIDAVAPLPGAPSYPDIAFYSSQGPTSDGRVKPDVVAPSCVISSFYVPCFAGTSAAAPAAAGMAALILGRGLATPGLPLAAMVRHLTIDRGPPGPDNAFGVGEISLPTPPTGTKQAAAQYIPLTAPTRILDTRPAGPIGPPALVGPQPPFALLDLTVAGVAGVDPTASAVAVNITSTGSTTAGYVQALPTLQSAVGATSTLNLTAPGKTRPNFAIVPIGDAGRITLYLPVGGNLVVDLLGYFVPSTSTPTSAGRFVAIEPERWVDSRGGGGSPLPAGVGWPRRAAAGEAVGVVRPPTSAVPTQGVAALVMNVTATDALGAGYLRAQPGGASGLLYSTVNFTRGEASANSAIVPLGADGTVSVFAQQPTHVVVDVVGYFTDARATPGADGLFVAVAPARAYDSRGATPSIFSAGESRLLPLTSPGAPQLTVPADASAVSANLAAVGPLADGYLRVYPSTGPSSGPSTVPSTSNVNFVAGDNVANAALLKLGASGTVTAQMSQAGHVIIDINGYFTGPP